MRTNFDRQMMLPLLVIALLGFSTAPASALPCTQISLSKTLPSSAHSVRPSDVAVLSAIGLPHTHSSELSRVLSRLHELLTMFNPAITSTLLGQTNLYSESSQHRALVEQAKELPLSLRSNQAVELDTDWKLVMLFVQVDELCVCQDQVSETIKAAVHQVDLALQVLQSQLKRTIVNVALWYGEYDTGFRYQNRMCQCMEEKHEGELRLLKAILTQVLQESLDRHLVEKQWYSNRDDFTVRLQDAPFITSDPASFISAAPRAGELHTDKLAVQMWANLLQPTIGQQNMEENNMIISVLCPSEDRPFLRTENNSPSDHTSEPSPLLDPIMGTHMPCEDRSPSNSPPTSVHALRPGDIKVVAAVGDSLTAGNGVGSGSSVINLLDVRTQYRGLSYSVGGDENLTTVTTLPNILREFNPSLTGYSVGKGKEHTPQAFLNQAVAGEKAKDIPDQVRALVARMKNDSHVNFQEDWKVITLFIGGNDMCEYCYNSLFYSTDNYVRHIRESLDYLHKQVPRALVNLVEPLYIPILRQMHTERNAYLKCPTWLANILCPCVISPKEGSVTLQKLHALNRDYQRGLHELVESGRYDTHNNFTVVLQPFLRDIIIPVTEDGRPDRTYFSPDCFHLSQKAQTRMARGLWNNMLEPLGKKTAQQDFNDVIPVKCPSKTSPFVRTYVNSNYTYEEPTPTPPPITNWGSDFSCGNFAPSTSVPTSVHKLRPGDIKVVAALGDSNTAAVGAKAKNVLQLNTQYKGVSWSIGGDQTLDTVTTLPNILKKFNPSLQGFSKGQGFLQSNGFNMAVPGAMAFDIAAQVQALIKAMKDDKKVNFEQDWKLVTLLVGARDLCDYCMDHNNLTPKNYSENLMLSLDMLYKEVPRVMVNVIEVLEMNPLRSVRKNDLVCNLVQRNACPCILNPEENSPELTEVRRINQEYQIETERLVSGGRYDGREDFTVVVQPYLQNAFVPFIGIGKPDLSFFSVDCFHISERAHAEMAIALWNNMLEPVGMKQVYNNFTYDRTKINCPSENQPFIFTKVNSLPSPPVTTTTPVPVTNTTIPSPVPQCDSSIPVWVPVLLGVTGLLIGWGITWLLMSCRERRNKRKMGEKEVEMKGTGF
ncbi:phospholipase B1, membrane-associated [Salmo trutta]|uniref:phospholipase B1, membrane-associated n=1 Tax=Salmo trutta TaxID=8032 RepID=UPI00113156DD|nr:phospholipase B1, membrane-associated-like [Salmo trutta]